MPHILGKIPLALSLPSVPPALLPPVHRPKKTSRLRSPELAGRGNAEPVGTSDPPSSRGPDPTETSALPGAPAPALLAAMLLAVEADRRDIRNRVATGFEEQVEAVANLYWPFLLDQEGGNPGAAIFDLTGVWKQSFRYTFMPPKEKLHALLEGVPSPEELLARMQAVTQSFTDDARTEVLTVEGLVPLAPQLQVELLSQTTGLMDPEPPEAARLPARHSVERYHQEGARMRAWLDRLEDDLGALRGFRAEVDALVQSTRSDLEQAHARAEAGAREYARQAKWQTLEKIAKSQEGHHAEVLRHLEAIGDAHRVVAQAETDLATSTTLATRAASRRDDARPHQVRAKEARSTLRAARRQIRDGQRAIEWIHEHQRDEQQKALAALEQIEQSGALTLAQHELLLDQFLAGASDLLQMVDRQISARLAQKEALSGCFLPLTAPASGRIVWLPTWVATFQSPRGARHIVFPPLKVRTTKGVTGTIKRLFGGMVLPFEPRTVQFDRQFRPTVEQALASDPWLSSVTRELTRAADLLGAGDVLVRLEEGLTELTRNGWISQKQGSDFLRSYTELLDRRKSRSPTPSDGGEGTILPEVVGATPALVPDTV